MNFSSRIFALFTLFIFWTCSSLSGQQFNGHLNSDFSGVVGVRANPSFVANSPYKFDFSLLNGNAYASSNIGNLITTNESTLFIRQFEPKQKYIQINAALGGFSGLISLPKKRGIAFQYGLRTHANGTDISQNFVYQVDRFDDLSFRNTSFSDESFELSTMIWQEFALTYGGILKESGFGRWKIGATLKLINPSGHVWVDLEGADYVIDNNGFATFDQFDISAGNSSNLDRYEYIDGNNPLQGLPKGIGLQFGGIDVGVTYEQLLDKPNPTTRQGTRVERDIDYQFRLSVALTDIGMASFEHGSVAFTNVNADSNLDYDDVIDLLEDASSLRGYRNVIDTLVQTADLSGAYTVSLPAAFRLNFDHNFDDNFYLGVSTVLDLSGLMPTDYRVSYANSITLTPRYETGRKGFYLPLFYNLNGETQLGMAMRYGPLTVGTHALQTIFSSERDTVGLFFNISFNLLKANSKKSYCFGSSKTGSALVSKKRTPQYKRKKFIFF